MAASKKQEPAPARGVSVFDSNSSLHLNRSQLQELGCDAIRNKKEKFDEANNKSCSLDPVLRGSAFGCSVVLRSPRKFFYSSNHSLNKTDDVVFICDWYPQLFGIDEDEIPSSEDEEGLFDIDWDDLDEKAESLTPSYLDMMRIGSRVYLSDHELRDLWKKDQVPKYGRRARQKPVLERENHEKFECICDIDTTYSRHYVPRYEGGVAREGEELKTPHFRAFWEDFKERADMADLDQSSDIFSKKTGEVKEEKLEDKHFVPIFPSSAPNQMRLFREEIRKSFRPLDCREVRRYRIPYAEAMYMELQEDLYLESAEFFKLMIIKDHFLHQNPENTGAYLRKQKSLIDKLVLFLKVAEKLSRRKEYHKEAMVLLKSGKYFNDHDKNWWWLAEELYVKAVKVSQNSVIDGGKSEAIANYILGTFMLDCVHRVQPAQEHLLKARELSLGKDWNAGRILNKVQDPIYQECANYLCRALIAVSRELREKGKPEEALPLIYRSHKLCKEATAPRRDIEMETYFELGMTYQEVGMLDWAKTAFRKFIEQAKMQNYARSICEGYLELAICFRREGDMNRCYFYLQSYLNTAIAKKDPNLIAFAHRYLGEFHLNNGNAKIAEEHFQKAFFSFLDQCGKAQEIRFSDWQPEHFTLVNDVELVRTLSGLALGEMLTKPIFQLIVKAKNNRSQKEIQLLVKWKNCNREKVPEVVEEVFREGNAIDLKDETLAEDLTVPSLTSMEDTSKISIMGMNVSGIMIRDHGPAMRKKVKSSLVME